MTIEDLKSRLADRGYRPSAGCWEDEETICVFSSQTHGPETYNHPCATIIYSKSLGKITQE